ncbi:hypothetical protein D9757_005082 [Collybiopsis confluens]|uniref:Uncharacterized protein n=1 Tax=Collybiopsis confluens TaxID=2823264 RepID=A0A8H5MCJ5_9AGAR|nr:hypothetical protein D9757_005082 [Collybiopsis confluens]
MSSAPFQSTTIPRKRHYDSEEFMTTDTEPSPVTPPKLRRILAKYPDQNSISGLPPGSTELSSSKSSSHSHPALDSIDLLRNRNISFRILRENVLQRDEIARMDGKSLIIDDIYDMNGNINLLAWPLTIKISEVPPKIQIAKALVVPTRILRSQRPSSSPASSKHPTPTSTPAPTSAPTVSHVYSLPPPPLALPVAIPPSTSSTRKVKAKSKPKPSASAIPTSVTIIKTEPTVVQIQPYKKLPCRGDTIQMRIAKLQADPWSDPLKLTAKSVYCLGCQKKVCLDKRFDYYPGFWETHKKRCPGVQRGRPPPSLPSLPPFPQEQETTMLSQIQTTPVALSPKLQ